MLILLDDPSAPAVGLLGSAISTDVCAEVSYAAALNGNLWVVKAATPPSPGKAAGEQNFFTVVHLTVAANMMLAFAYMPLMLAVAAYVNVGDHVCRR